MKMRYVMRVRMKSEEGFVLPLMLGVTLVMSVLMLGVASRLEVKTFSYERRQVMLRMILLEKETVLALDAMVRELDTMSDYELLPNSLVLRNGVRVNLNTISVGEKLQVGYNILYNESMRQGSLNFDKRRGVIHVE